MNIVGTNVDFLPCRLKHLAVNSVPCETSDNDDEPPTPESGPLCAPEELLTSEKGYTEGTARGQAQESIWRETGGLLLWRTGGCCSTFSQ